ncbi:d-galactonate transporter [Tolumonas auensis DSM 9187]|uniref:D-galactonate transporter n=1 Tax=Tolumonas auensis (strain DSM 9187 / NBRC 110442 / TA 4) TaxID=595494 RepID=C4LAX5_TOLAT|nr:MFS transporter [Tolumonas auensis]ACQ94178.1 d-galactonate transporter [Tolumonas auensis DSM 9187]
MESVNTMTLEAGKRTNVRYWIVVMLFIVTAFNYGDRATLSIAGASMTKDLGLDSVGMGYVFSAFSWAYVIGQIPGGWLLDKFGSKRVYFVSILTWSIFTLLQGFVGSLGSISNAVIGLFILRFMVGLCESPSFPGNSRIVAAWFPAQERGTAVSIFNSAQYFATVIFAPIMGWLTHAVGWSHVFFFMGGLGILLSFVWLKVIKNPTDHPSMNRAELEYIEQGGALTNMDQPAKKAAMTISKWDAIKQLLQSRMMVGVYLGQYCINALTYFFITWFPVYLVQERGMSILKAGFIASIPAICGFTGGVLGGIISDHMLRRGYSLTIARKTPIVLGMMLSMSMVICNYVDSEFMVIAIMAAAFFGKGVGALGWAVMADTAPKEISGLSGGLFNMFGNISGIVTPIAIGYIISATGSFNGALVYVGMHALLAIVSFIFIVGTIKRIELKY